MKGIIACLLVLFSVTAAIAQRNFPSQKEASAKLFDARYVQKPPVYPFGVDSCKRYYFSHFSGFDSVLTKAVERGDTAKYIRVYFSFIIDKNGIPYDPTFERIASTQYARSVNAKTIQYFSANKKYYDGVIKLMISPMPFWKPALYNAIPVDCKINDYIQFWVGLTPPGN